MASEGLEESFEAERRMRITRGENSSKSLWEENCPLEALRGSFSL